MRLTDRFHHALGSHLGTVFVGLILALVLLSAIYWFLVVRQKRRDLLAYMHRSYYEKAATMAKNFLFVGAHKADFFGRHTIVKLPQGGYGLCLIPPPIWIDASVKDRFRCFHLAKDHLNLPLFAPMLWRGDDPAVMMIEGGLVDGRGRLLTSLKQHLMDSKLGLTTREQILLELARALSCLHEQRAEFGGMLYHGFLLPRSLYLALDADYRVSQLVVAHAGMAFAMGPDRCVQQLTALKAGMLPVEKYCANELLDQLPMLAPEQKIFERTREVGPAADFFAFATLAISLLSHQRFVSVDKVDWKKVPEKWRPFLQACLQDDPTKRPKDFAELEDWLNDPELALTYSHSVVARQELDIEDQRAANLLTDILKKAQIAVPSMTEDGTIDQHLQDGLKAIKAEKWHAARTSLTKVIRSQSDHAMAQVNLAIACYELGDRGQAEKHYEVAKKADPLAAKSFRQHLAFRL